MVHRHTISSERHSSLLGQERRDPITGEPLCAGDRVVFCAGCGSAFLEDSWHYLQGEHCGQRDTLKDVPAQPEKLTLVWQALDGKLCRTISTMQGREFAITMFLTAISLGLISGLFSFESLSPFTYSLAFLIYAIRRRGQISHVTVFKNGLRVHRFLRKKKDHRLHEIENIHVYERRENVLFGHTLEVTIKFKGKAAETFLFGSYKSRIHAFFKALGYLSAQTRVTFDLPPEGKLYKMVQSLRASHRFDGNFSLKGDQKECITEKGFLADKQAKQQGKREGITKLQRSRDTVSKA